jgi:hypothetical protein
MPRPSHQRTVERDPLVVVVLNLKHEVVHMSRLLQGDEPTVTAVLRCGGQLLRIPRSQLAGVKPWDVLHVERINHSRGAPPAPRRMQVPEHAGSPFD